MSHVRQWWFTSIALPLALFAVALVLRVWLAGAGLPYVEHIDEPAVLETAIRMVRDGDFHPHTFKYPSLYYYLLAGTIKLHVWWGVAQGIYSSDKDIPFKNYGITSVPDLYIWARTLTALLAAATVPAVYALGRRMFNLRTGLLAALALTVTMFHVRHSRYVTVDAPTGLWVALAVLGAWGVAVRGHWRDYLLAGAAAGLAAGTKYNAGVVVAAIAAAHLLHWGRSGAGRPLARLALAAAAALATFLATSPYALLDWRLFVGELRFNSTHYAAGEHGDFIGRWQLAGYAAFFWNEALFPPACLIALAGLPALARRYPRQLIVLLSVAVAGMTMLLSYATHFTRNVLPILPLLALLAAAAAVALADLLPRGGTRMPADTRRSDDQAPVLSSRGLLRAGALAGLSLALVLPLAAATYRHLAYWGRPYTMVAAAAALAELPHGLRAAAELPPTLLGGMVAVFPVERITAHTLEWYRANGFRYLVANDDLRTPEDQLAYERLRAAATVLVAYPPRRAGVQPGPSGAILDLGEDLAAMRFTCRELRFGDAVLLLGYEARPGEPRARITPLEGADERTLAPGQPLQINLYWRSLRPMATDYVLFIHVLNAAGERVAQRDLPLRNEDYPTSQWRAGELVIDRADMALPALPAGRYRLLIGLYDGATGARLPTAEPEPALLELTIRK